MMETWFPTFRKLGRGHLTAPSFSWWPLYTTAAQRRSLLRLIAVATEENLPLVPLLESWAADERGLQRSRLLQLLALLRRGTPLPDAIDAVPGLLRPEDALAVRFDAQSGTRTAAVRQALAEFDETETQSRSGVRQTVVYVVVVFLVALLLTAFVQTKILPVIIRMLGEFSLDLPAVSALSWQMSQTLASDWWIIALAALVALWALLFTEAGRWLRDLMLYPLSASGRQWRSAGVLELLGVAMHAGRPLPGALSTLARYHFDPGIRNKLLFIRNEVELGADAWQCMGKAGLLTPPEVRLLAASQRLGNRGWALQQLVAVKRRRTTERLERAAQFLMPALVIAMGGFVLFQSLTVFLPLVELISSLV
jgi:type II secretory pathway component PulF